MKVFKKLAAAGAALMMAVSVMSFGANAVTTSNHAYYTGTYVDGTYTIYNYHSVDYKYYAYNLVNYKGYGNRYIASEVYFEKSSYYNNALISGNPKSSTSLGHGDILPAQATEYNINVDHIRCKTKAYSTTSTASSLVDNDEQIVYK